MKHLIGLLISLFCISGIAKELTVNVEDAFYMAGYIDDRMDEAFAVYISKLNAKKQQEVIIIINSPGGLVIDGASMINTLKSSKLKSTCVVRGLSASMATIFLEHCDVRYATQSSIFMFHQASGSLSGNLDQMKSRLDAITQFVDFTDEIIIKRLKLTKEEYTNKCLKEWWIATGSEAKKQNVIDDVVELNLNFKQPIPVISLYDEERKKRNNNNLYTTPDLGGIGQVITVTH